MAKYFAEMKDVWIFLFRIGLDSLLFLLLLFKMGIYINFAVNENEKKLLNKVSK